MRATQFFEFAQGTIDMSSEGDTARLAPVGIQLDALVREALAATNDPRTVAAGPDALYSGAQVREAPSSRPGRAHRRDPFTDWLARRG
ncbi:hypothetical protein ACF1HJ_11985 [Streptomyces sp. NPDC013978]|uniref:hypothetical protein n=1 Tax=Streptomyces sp. NPDC013978 TaxID=3364869 RepID=UPI0036F9BB4E